MTETAEYNSCLSIVPIFAGLAEADLRKIDAIVTHEKFAKGETLFGPGEVANKLLILHQGQVKLTSYGSEGQEKIVSLLQAGDFDGTASLFEPEEHTLYGVAVTNGEACVVKRDAFQEVIQESPQLALHLLNAFGNKLVKQQKESVRNSTTDARGRVASYLLEYSNQVNDKRFVLPFKKYELANLLDLTPETLSRQLKNLEKDELIKNLPHNTIEIVDEDELSFLI